MTVGQWGKQQYHDKTFMTSS